MMQVSILISIFSSICLIYVGHVQSDNFHPLTEDVSIEAVYRLQAFVKGEADFVSEIRESYQHDLSSSSIKLYRQNGSTQASSRLLRSYLYEPNLRRDIELVERTDESAGQEEDDGRLQVSACKWERARAFGAGDRSLEKIIFEFESSKEVHLDFDLFLTRECLEKVDKKLHYVRGLTHLLNLLECRRTAFKLAKDESKIGQKNGSAHPSGSYTRTSKTVLYSVTNLPALTDSQDTSLAVRELNMSVSLRYNEKFEPPEVLPSGAVPMSLSVQIEQLDIWLLINVFQLEIEPTTPELLNAESYYCLPPACGLYDQLSPSASFMQYDGKISSSFSFRSRMSISDFQSVSATRLADLQVVYNNELTVLARHFRWTETSSSETDTEGVNTHSSRIVMDAKSGHKFHVMYYERGSGLSRFGAEADPNWRDCVSDRLSPVEKLSLYDAESNILRLDFAVYLGKSSVRGIPCNVFETRRFMSLPVWLGLDLDNLLTENGDIYATIYQFADRSPADKKWSQAKNSYSRSNQILQVDFNILTRDKSPKLMLKLQLDMLHFEWALTPSMLHLFDIEQECLSFSRNSSYLEMQLEIEPNEVEANDLARVMGLLEKSSLLQKRVISKLLADSYQIPASQQANLEVELRRHTGSEKIAASLTVHELPPEKLEMTFVGYAEDHSTARYGDGRWQTGFSSMSLSECKWLAAHTLLGSDFLNYNRVLEEDRRLLMFCRHSLHCVLENRATNGSALGWRVPATGKVTSNQYFRFPVSSDTKKRCVISQVSRSTVDTNQRLRGSGERLLDWLVSERSSFTGKPVDLLVDENRYSFQTGQVSLPNLIGKQRDKQTLGLLTGVGYLSAPAVEAASVSSLADCSAACMILDECQSYSFCQLSTGLECVLSRINWTEPNKVKELVGLAEQRARLRSRAGDSGSGSGSISLRLPDSQTPVQVKLRTTPVCSLGQVHSLDSFEFLERKLDLISPASYLLQVDSLDDCAKFCLDRATVMSQTNLSSYSEQFQPVVRGNLLDNNEAVCTRFKSGQINESLRFCELLPSLKLEPTELINSLPAPWRRAANRIRERKLARFEDSETYGLLFSRLFLETPAMRLELAETGKINHLQVQLAVQGLSYRACAKLCLERVDCRSFDIGLQLAGGRSSAAASGLDSRANSDASFCVLNNGSLADIRRAGEQSRLIKRQQLASSAKETGSGAPVRWLHHEPTDVALHLKGVWRVTHTNWSAAADVTSARLFIGGLRSAAAAAAAESGAGELARDSHWAPVLVYLAALLLLAAALVYRLRGAGSASPAGRPREGICLRESLSAQVGVGAPGQGEMG